MGLLLPRRMTVSQRATCSSTCCLCRHTGRACPFLGNHHIVGGSFKWPQADLPSVIERSPGALSTARLQVEHTVSAPLQPLRLQHASDQTDTTAARRTPRVPLATTPLQPEHTLFVPYHRHISNKHADRYTAAVRLDVPDAFSNAPPLQPEYTVCVLLPPPHI